MKRKIFFAVLIVLYLLLPLVLNNNSETFVLYRLPFIPIASFLRFLSLYSFAGNVLAIVLFILISLVPFVFCIYLYIYKKIYILDIVFISILSLCMGIIMYYFINPYLISDMLILDVGDIETEFIEIYQTALCITFYSIILLYCFIKICRNKKINLLVSVNFLIDLSICVLLYFIITTQILILKNTVFIDSSITNIYVIGSILFDITIYSILIIILVQTKDLITLIYNKQFDDKIIDKSKKIYNIGYILTILCISVPIIKNTYQLILFSHFTNTDFLFSIPIGIMILTIFLMILSKYFSQVNILNQDNELMI